VVRKGRGIFLDRVPALAVVEVGQAANTAWSTGLIVDLWSKVEGMILIRDVLVSDEVVQEHFVCHLERCKGACCVGGDFGAPLEDEEIHELTAEFVHIRPFMDPSGVKAIEAHGVFQVFDKPVYNGVTLRDDAACAFVRVDDQGVAHCTIEEAWKAGATSFRKPISCHLYPVRVTRSKETRFEALNYHRWDLCSPACAHGRALQVPVYRFVREALVRKYGADFYQELDEVAGEMAL
jgi:hypothetical protein